MISKLNFLFRRSRKICVSDSEYQSFGGCQPAETHSRRTATSLSLLRFNSATVALPIGVLPFMRVKLSLHSKWRVPVLAARVKERNGRVSLRIENFGFVGFGAVAGFAQKPEIFFVVCAAFGKRSEVVNPQHIRQILLPKQTIPAAMFCRLADFFFDFFGNVSACHSAEMGGIKPRSTATRRA